MGIIESLIENMTEDKKIPEKTNDHAIEIFSEIFTGMHGNYTRLKIVSALSQEYLNKNQLAKKLNYDFKSIQYSLEILQKANLVDKMGSGYGETYFITDFLADNLGSLYHVLKKAEKRINKKKTYVS